MSDQKPWYPPGEGWIEWHGGPNPVPGALVDVLEQYGRDQKIIAPWPGHSEEWDWDYKGDPDGVIVAYRVVTPAPSTVDRALFDEALKALEASQKAIREYREFGAPHAFWDDVEAANIAALSKAKSLPKP